MTPHTTTVDPCISTFNQKFRAFKQKLSKSEKYVYDLIKRLDVLHVRKVNVLHGAKRYEVVFNNGYYVTIPKELYDLHPEKKTKFSNF